MTAMMAEAVKDKDAIATRDCVKVAVANISGANSIPANTLWSATQYACQSGFHKMVPQSVAASCQPSEFTPDQIESLKEEASSRGVPLEHVINEARQALDELSKINFSEEFLQQSVTNSRPPVFVCCDNR